jgi:thioredoxin-related protein
VAAFVNASLLLVLSFLSERKNLRRFAFEIMPMIIVIASAFAFFFNKKIPMKLKNPNKIKILVFKDERCPHCRQLQDEIMPVIENDLGEKLIVKYVDAQDYPWIMVTPTIFVVYQNNANLHQN